EMGASALLPELKLPFLGRVLGQGAIGGGGALLRGENPIPPALTSMGLQAGTEALFAPFRAIKSGIRGQGVQNAYTESEAARKAAYEADKVAKTTAHENLVGSEQAKYESNKSIFDAGELNKASEFASAQANRAEEGARKFADDMKSKTPALADIPSDTRGLV